MILKRLLSGLTTTLARRVAVPLYRGQLRRFERLLQRAKQVQRELLFSRIERCRDTRFGRDHGFAEIRTLDDFRRHVPVARYSHFEPYIDAVARGDTAALFPADETVLRFTITTGTTGKPKLNPVTTTWLKEYRHAWNAWGVKLMLDHPRHIGKKILQLAGTWNMGQTPSGLQISMVSALLARYQNPFVRPFYTVPNEVTEIADLTSRYYTILRLSVPERVGFVFLMNPGTLVRLAELGNEHRAALIRDIHDGTLSNEFEIPAAIRQRLARRVRPARECARDLERIVEQTGRLYPCDYWQQPVIGCWLGGTAGYQSRYLRDYFGDSPLRDLGLVSSEGRHTIPLADNDPAGVLSIATGYYEFIPEDEGDVERPTVLEGHELEVGRNYHIVLTTFSGYFRFHIGDLVCCRDFFGEAPLIEFLQKSERCGDLEGEKVTEHQFIEAADEAARSLGLRLTQVTAVPWRIGREAPRYVVLVEHGDIPDVATALKFLDMIDRKLMATNFLYSARRREQVIASPRLQRIPTGSWSAYIDSQIADRGTSDAHYKHPALVQDQSLLARFTPIDTV